MEASFFNWISRLVGLCIRLSQLRPQGAKLLLFTGLRERNNEPPARGNFRDSVAEGIVEADEVGGYVELSGDGIQCRVRGNLVDIELGQACGVGDTHGDDDGAVDPEGLPLINRINGGEHVRGGVVNCGDAGKTFARFDKMNGKHRIRAKWRAKGRTWGREIGGGKGRRGSTGGSRREGSRGRLSGGRGRSRGFGGHPKSESRGEGWFGGGGQSYRRWGW